MAYHVKNVSQTCRHTSIKLKYCMRCGIYYDENLNIYGLKHESLNRERLESHDIIGVLRNNQFDLTRNKDYRSLNQDIYQKFNQINRICNLINSNFQTKILSMYIFWHSIQQNQRFQLKDIYFSVIISLKALQPYLLRNYNLKVKQRVHGCIFEGQQAQKIEQTIFQQMIRLKKINFKLKIVSFIDYLQFYVMSGVMFNFQIKKNRKSDYNKIIQQIDNQIQKHIQNGLFFTYPNQQYLALKILYEARQKCSNVDEVWNWHVQQITKTKRELVQQIVNQRKALRNRIISTDNSLKNRQDQNKINNKKQNMLEFNFENHR